MKIWDEYNWDIWNPEKEPLPVHPSRYRKISICTTCMNRIYDLRQTLPKNIEDNKSYPNAEFVLLDYNSTDGLGDWVKKNMMDHINSGRLVYFRTTEPKYFRMGHSRNVAFKLATGDIVNNVDADNYTGKGFIETINKMAEICPESAIFAKGKRMMHGRIGLYKDEFISLGGYDEDLVGYGFDDHSVVYRAMALGYKFMWWNDLGDFANRIRTPRRDVTKYYPKNLKKWKDTEVINKKITMEKLLNKEFIVNTSRHWGKTTVVKNFEIKISI